MNPVRMSDGCALYLRDGSAVILDAEVYQLLIPRFRFYRQSMGNRRVMIYERAKWGVKGKQFCLDRVLMGAGRGEWVRHINGNVADCRFANMVLVRIRHDAFEPSAVAIVGTDHGRLSVPTPSRTAYIPGRDPLHSPQ